MLSILQILPEQALLVSHDTKIKGSRYINHKQNLETDTKELKLL
jgi:hypothetical protein